MGEDKNSDCGEDVPLVRTRYVGMKGLGLRDFSLVPILTDEYERVGVNANASVLDLRHVAAYVCALQVVGACLVMTAVSIAVPHLLPFEGRNAVRDLVASAVAAAVLLARPMLALNPGQQLATMGPPVKYVFKSLRACAFFVLGSWAVEALLYSECGDDSVHAIHSLRHAALVLAFLGVAVASCFRAVFPTSTSDVHVAAALLCLVLLVCAPQSQSHLHNPLSRSLPFVDGLVRAIRVTLFAVTYTACCLASAPARIFELEPLVLSMRAFAATAWILVAPPQLLFAQPFFLGLLCTRRVKLDAPDASDASDASDAPIVNGVFYADDIEIQETYPKHATALQQQPPPTHSISEERKRVLLSRLSGA